MSTAPTWYDVLDVPREASADEVRAAWKSQIADLEPGDRRFDALNRAAKVLLDADARAAYDATLADAEADDPEADAPDVGAPASPLVEAGAPVPVTSPHWRTRLAPRRTSPHEVSPEGVAEAAAEVRPASSGVPTWLLAGLGVLAAGLVAAVVWTWGAAAQGDDATAREAQVAAERAVVPVLSYDFEHLDADRKAATALMTGSYRAEYDKLFAVLEDNAPRTKTRVTAEVVASGIVRATDDRVQVLVFVDRPTTNKLSAEPTVYKDQVTVSMQRVDGEWLVDDLITSPVRG